MNSLKRAITEFFARRREVDREKMRAWHKHEEESKKERQRREDVSAFSEIFKFHPSWLEDSKAYQVAVAGLLCDLAAEFTTETGGFKKKRNAFASFHEARVALCPYNKKAEDRDVPPLTDMNANVFEWLGWEQPDDWRKTD